MAMTLYLHFLQFCTEAKFFSFTRNKDNFQKVSFYSGFIISFCLRLSSTLSISAMASTASSSSSLDSINTYKKLIWMKWDQDYTVKKKYTETKTKNKQKQNQPEKWKINDSFLLTRCWRHVLWADDVKLPFSAQGKWKIKHISSFITGGGGGMKGNHMVFTRTEEGKTVIAEYKGGGGL